MTDTPAEQPPARRSARRTPEQLREAIINAALEMMDEVGNIGLTVQIVARRAKCTTGAIYANFGSREGLITAAYDQRMSSVVNSKESLRFLSQAAFSGAPEHSEEQRAIRRALLSPEGRRGRLQWLEGVVEGTYSPELRVRAEQLNNEARDIVASHIARAQREGWVRTDLDPQAMALVWLALGVGLAATVTDADNEDPDFLERVNDAWQSTVESWRTH